MKKTSRLTEIALCMTLPFMISIKANNSSNEMNNKEKNTIFNYNIKTGIFGNKIKINSGNLKLEKDKEEKTLSIDFLSGMISYCFYKPNDSIYIEKTKFPSELYVYKKKEEKWHLTKYESKKKRKYKKDLVKKFKTNSIPLVNISKKHLNSEPGDTTNFFLLGEEYYFVKKEQNAEKSKFEIGGIKKRKEDKTLFNKNIIIKSKNKNSFPENFKTSFKVKKNNIFKGEYSIIGKKK